MGNEKKGVPSPPIRLRVCTLHDEAASPQTIWGRGQGEGALCARCQAGQPPHPACRPPSPPISGEKELVETILFKRETERR